MYDSRQSRLAQSRLAMALITAALFAGGTSIARAEMMTMKATLNATSEVPPNDSKGTGTGEFTYDTSTKALTYTVTYSGLTGAATAGHIHGPAAPGANAGVMVPFQNAGTSPIKGTATLTDAQAADLMAGRTYVNVHTAAHGGGEIRGQITK
jgi:hypothetical protein